MTRHDSDLLLHASAVSRCFDDGQEQIWAVRNVDLVVTAGTFTCLIGASGSGKSTLLSLLAGLEAPTTGNVEVFGQSLWPGTEGGRIELRRKYIGVVFQAHNLIEELTAVENVALPLEADGCSSRSARLLAHDALERVGLGGLDRRFPYQLSGGQQQRVGIARGIVGDRRLLLADEPTGALDSGNTRSLFESIRSMCDQGISAIVATHDHSARQYADSTLEIIDGVLSPAQALAHR